MSKSQLTSPNHATARVRVCRLQLSSGGEPGGCCQRCDSFYPVSALCTLARSPGLCFSSSNTYKLTNRGCLGPLSSTTELREDTVIIGAERGRGRRCRTQDTRSCSLQSHGPCRGANCLAAAQAGAAVSPLQHPLPLIQPGASETPFEAGIRNWLAVFTAFSVRNLQPGSLGFALSGPLSFETIFAESQ